MIILKKINNFFIVDFIVSRMFDFGKIKIKMFLCSSAGTVFKLFCIKLILKVNYFDKPKLF